jgi:hypothetical protein
MKKSLSLTMALVLFGAGIALGADQGSTASSSIPHLVNYQGVLTTQAGDPVQNGTYDILFGIYDTAEGGNLKWDHTYSVTVTKGLFNVILGESDPIDLPFDEDYWLEMRLGNDPPLVPRIRLTSVGYAYRAEVANAAVVAGSGGGWVDDGAVVRLENNTDRAGIGTDDPWRQLHVHSDTSQGQIAISGASDNGVTYSALYLHGDTLPDYWVIAHKAMLGTPVEDALEFLKANPDGSHRMAMTIHPDGKVGIGTNDPIPMLHIKGDDPDVGLDMNSASSCKNVELRFGLDGVRKANVYWSRLDNRLYLTNQSTGNPKSLAIDQDGNVSIEGGLALPGNFGPDNQYVGFHGNHICFGHPGVSEDFIGYKANTFYFKDSPGGGDVSDPNVVIGGRTTTRVLEITGGSDLAEPFPISYSSELPPGSAVIIDDENPGHLTLSSNPYDRRVAGIVSGAGGINSGLTLSQQGVMEGDQNIALSGRVYVLATASNGAIKPGDLLTTSSIPGHAMKSTDKARSHGAIIGKAMGSLEEGEDLVLVLVTLH